MAGFLSVVLVLCLAEGVSPSEANERCWPFLVALGFPAGTDDIFGHVSSGVILDQYTILTTGTCAAFLHMFCVYYAEIRVIAGTNDLKYEPTRQICSILRVKTHPYFLPRLNEGYNLGVVNVQEPWPGPTSPRESRLNLR